MDYKRHLCLLHQIYQAEMDQRLLFVKPLRLPHWNGLTCPCVYYTKVTALELTGAHLSLLHQTYTSIYYTKVSSLKWTKVHLSLLHQSCRTELGWRALAFISPRLLQWNGIRLICVYYTKVTALKWTNVDLFLLHQSYHARMDLRALVFITPKLPH